MLNRIVLFCLILTLGILVVNPKAIADTRILILGDSLSASYQMKPSDGWVQKLQQKFTGQGKEITLINASISGETTAGGLARLGSALKRHKPDLLLIELGGNDGLRGFPPKKTQQNLLQIIDKALAENVSPALMQIRIPPNFGPRYTSMFEGIYPKIVKQTGVPLLPFFMEQIAGHPDLILPDGLHPNKAAMPKIADIMEKTILNWVEGRQNKS